MSKRVSRLLGFAPSTSADVAGYLLFFGPSKNADGSDHVLSIDEDGKANIGIPPSQQVGADTLLVVSLADIPEVQALAEGEYDFGVAAVDAVGNISDITEAEDVTLDITPPAAPAKVLVVSAP